MYSQSPSLAAKITATFIATLAITAFSAAAADVDAVDAKDITPMLAPDPPLLLLHQPLETADEPANVFAFGGTGISINVAAKDIVNKSTALVTNNTLAMDGNVFVLRRNLTVSPNDRVGVMRDAEVVVVVADTYQREYYRADQGQLKTVTGENINRAMMANALPVKTSMQDELNSQE